jgi:hypothetical protein
MIFARQTPFDGGAVGDERFEGLSISLRDSEIALVFHADKMR